MFLKPTYTIQTGENNPILRKKSIAIDTIDADIKKFANILIDMMYQYDGVGLASPQLGENIRIIAVTKRRGKKITKEFVMINPEIISSSQEKEIDEEGCISLPNIIGKVQRSTSIIIKYTDIKGNHHTKKLKGYNARIIQHEIDHLNGILFTDKLIEPIEHNISENWKEQIAIK